MTQRSLPKIRGGTPPFGGDGGTHVVAVVEDRVDQLAQVVRLEQRAVALGHLRELFAPHHDRGLLQLRTVMGQGHSADRIGNQFGAKLVSAFLKRAPATAWLAYQRLRPMTVGEEMASLLNRNEFEQMHDRLHQRLRLSEFSIETDARCRIEEDFHGADANQFGGPAAGDLAELRRDGLNVELEARHAAEVARVAQELGESPIPISEVLKGERFVTVSGKGNSKVSLLIHDLIDHLWTLDLLDRSALLDEYSTLLSSIGNPHLRDIRSREGEIFASIAHGVRMFNVMEPGFEPIVSAVRLRRLLETRVHQGSPLRHRRALELVTQATRDSRTGGDRRTLASESLSFTFSNYITELNEQRRKHGKIKQRRPGFPTRELPPFDVDFVAFFVECHHALMTPKNQHRNSLGKGQLLIEEWLLDIANERAEPPFRLTLGLDTLSTYRPELTHLPSVRARWILEHLGFAASPMGLT